MASLLVLLGTSICLVSHSYAHRVMIKRLHKGLSVFFNRINHCFGPYCEILESNETVRSPDGYSFSVKILQEMSCLRTVGFVSRSGFSWQPRSLLRRTSLHSEKSYRTGNRLYESIYSFSDNPPMPPLKSRSSVICWVSLLYVHRFPLFLGKVMATKAKRHLRNACPGKMHELTSLLQFRDR